MKCLSINPPYAEMLIKGEKREEYRTWKTTYRGPLAIHETLKGAGRGAVIGIVEITDCIQISHSRYAWIVKHPRRINPVLARGMPGIFEVEIHFVPTEP